MKLFRKREWQRLLTAVVMLLAFGSLARAGADLVVVGAGYGHYEGTLPDGVNAVVRHLEGNETDNNNRFWVDIKNIGDQKISNSDGQNGRKKLGIAFELNGTWTKETGSYNDYETWEIPADNVVRFYVNGGAEKPLNGLSGEQSLKITIAQNENNADYNNLPVPQKDYTAKFTTDGSNVTITSNNFYVKYEASYTVKIIEDGKEKEVTVTALKGVLADGSVDENTPGDFNRPYSLVQGNYYDFGKAPVGVYATRSVLWDRFEVDGKTFFRFKGITANYRIQKVTKLTHRLKPDGKTPVADVDFTTHTFLKVEPLNKDFAEKNIDWNVNNSKRTENFQNRDEVFPNFRNTNDDDVWGYGCLYIAGFGFGYGEYDKYEGWNARWKPEGSDDKYTMFDNHMWVPSPKKNLYKFRLKGGENISNDKNKGFNVKFFLNNYAKKLNDGGKAEKWDDWNLENSWRGSNVAETHSYADKWNSKDYPYLMHLAETRDFFEITGNIPEYDEPDNTEKLYSPDWQNGNFKTKKIGFDSDTPALPEGYIFEITLDLTDTENNGPDKWKAHDNVNGALVQVERIKDDFALSYVNLGMVTYNEGSSKNEDIHYVLDTDNTTTCEVFLSKFNKNQKNEAGKDVTKRLKLRDALRFDYGIPYANQYVAKSEEEKDPSLLNKVLKFKKLIINGALDAEDMQYLSWLAKKNKLITLDLSNAILPNGKIPGPVNIDNENELTNFGGKSESLTHVIMPTEGVNSVGEYAFYDCKNLENVKEIVEKVHGNIYDHAFENCVLTKELDVKNVTSIGNRAFAGCVNLVKVTVPATVNGKDIAGTTVEVGERWTDNKVSLTTNNEKNIIEAEWFNAGNNKGYMKASGDHYKQGDDTYRAQEGIGNLGIKSGDGKYSAGRNIGWNEAGAYYNYTFSVTNPGWYKFGAKYGSGGTGTKALKATFDNDSDTEIGVSFDNSNTEWDKGNWDWHDNDGKLVYLTEGDHVMKINVTVGGLELDAYRLTYQNNDNIPTTGTEITDAKSKETFDGVPANNCEVVFTGSDEESNWAAYRQQDGWMSLLKKTMDSKSPYKVVYQKHANAEVTRPSMKEGWNSVVYPFDVTGKILSNAKAGDAKAFDRAATLYDNKLDNDGYAVRLRFKYLDNKDTFQDDGETIANGTPFILHFSKVTGTDEAYTFEDVTTYAWDASAGMGGYSKDQVVTYGKKVTEDDNEWSFTGRLNYDSEKPVVINDEIYWIVGSSYYHKNADSNMKMTNFVSWFEAHSKVGANAIETLFGFMENDATGIKVVNSEASNSKNGNVYSLQGQIVRRGTTSVEGLPKGVYVVAGNRVVVK